KAIEYLERSRDMTPFVPRTWEYLAYAYLHDDKPAPALAAAIHANGMEGAHPSLNYTVIAGAYEKLGRYDEAVGAWRSAVRINRDALWLDYAMQSRALARAGRKDAAMAALDVAYKKTLNDPSLLNVIKRLRVAIASDCYARDSRACDPLEGWVV